MNSNGGITSFSTKCVGKSVSSLMQYNMNTSKKEDWWRSATDTCLQELGCRTFCQTHGDYAGRHKGQSKVLKGMIPINYLESNIREADTHTNDA